MNLRIPAGILATGSIALALIGGGVGAAVTDHWGATQNGTVSILPPPPPNVVLTVTSNSQGAVVDPIAKTVTFANYAVTTPASDPMFGGAYDQLSISSTGGTGNISVSAAITGTMLPAELSKISLMNGPQAFPLSAVPVVVATHTGSGTLSLGMQVNWAGLTSASAGNFTVTYSIDAS